MKLDHLKQIDACISAQLWFKRNFGSSAHTAEVLELAFAMNHETWVKWYIQNALPYRLAAPTLRIRKLTDRLYNSVCTALTRQFTEMAKTSALKQDATKALKYIAILRTNKRLSPSQRDFASSLRYGHVTDRNWGVFDNVDTLAIIAAGRKSDELGDFLSWLGLILDGSVPAKYIHSALRAFEKLEDAVNEHAEQEAT